MENFGFELLNDGDLEALLDNADSSNTKKLIKFAVTRLEQFEKFTGEEVPVGDVAKLDEFLGRLYASFRQKKGELYQKKSMQSIRYGLQRHFMQISGCDIVDGSEFKESSKIWKAVMVKLKQAGKGSVQHKAAISKLDMAKIQDSAELDQSTPKGLQNKVFVDVMVYFGNRGRKNVRNMTPTDYIIETDDEGLQYVIHRDMLTKTRRADNDEAFSGAMYEIPGPTRCPVAAFSCYVSKLNKNLPGVLWQKPKKSENVSEDEWYEASPLGKNTLGNKIKDISKTAGCARIYTNHSLRATCITILDNAGFESRDIMAVSDHKSESSLKHYVKTSDAKKKCMSASLAKEMYQEREPAAARPSPRPVPKFDLTDIPRTSHASSGSGDQGNGLPVHTTIQLHEAQQKALVDAGSTQGNYATVGSAIVAIATVGRGG